MTSGSKVALITGGNRGIGLAIAEKFKSDGYQVVVTHRSGSAPAGIEGVIMDVTDSESVNSAVASVEAKYGKIDVLVANAGITKDGLVMRMSDADFESVIDTNLNGTINTLYFAKKHQAAIIFLSTSRVYPYDTLAKANLETTPKRFNLSNDQSFVGISQQGIAENYPLEGLRSLYGATKLASEYFIQEFSNNFAVSAIFIF
jgi:NAD(P)-dependent dehydrogenase (short-subunit alcohol dehydrogenase family)